MLNYYTVEREIEARMAEIGAPANTLFVCDAGVIDVVVADDGSVPALRLHHAALQKRVAD